MRNTEPQSMTNLKLSNVEFKYQRETLRKFFGEVFV